MSKEEIIELLETITNDRGVPRNIREKVSEAIAKVKLFNVTSLSEAIYILDDISNDINMPSHARTDIWEAISMIEADKEKIK